MRASLNNTWLGTERFLSFENDAYLALHWKYLLLLQFIWLKHFFPDHILDSSKPHPALVLS